MAVSGFGPSDFVALAKFAWEIYDNVRDSRENFHRLNIDVECLLVSIGSLDKGHTQELISDYVRDDQGQTRHIEIRALRDGLNSVVMPFYALFERYAGSFEKKNKTKKKNGDGDGNGNGLRPVSREPIAIYIDGSTTTTVGDADEDRRRRRPWRKWNLTGWTQRLRIAFELKDLDDLRARFAVQAANLNLFMSRLTHTQLQRQTELITLRLAEQSLLDDGRFKYARDLDRAETDFRMNVAVYVKFLMDGGKPFSNGELYLRRSEAESEKERERLALTLAARDSEDDDDEVSDAGRLTTGHGRAKPLRMTEYQSYGRESKIREEKKKKEKTKQKLDGEHALATPTGISLDDDARFKLDAALRRLEQADILDGQTGTEIVELDPTLAVPLSEKNKPTSILKPPRRSDSTTSSSSSSSETHLAPRKQKRPKDLARRPSSEFICDVCRHSIYPGNTFYRCESGRCGKNGDTFDMCKDCYHDGKSCPGFDSGKCEDLLKMVWKGRE